MNFTLALQLFYTVLEFLALLDFVSRAHEIEIRPSIVRVAIISEPNLRISFEFWLLLPLGHMLTRCFFFFLIFHPPPLH